MSDLLTEEEFTLKAIRNLRTGSYKGIHTVFSGFNEAFRKYFGTDPVASMKNLAAEGKIVLRPARRGATIYEPSNLPPELKKPRKKDCAKDAGTLALEKILKKN